MWYTQRRRKLGSVIVIVALVGLVSFLSYRGGKESQIKKEALSNVEAAQRKKDIRGLNDRDLDERLSKYWGDE